MPVARTYETLHPERDEIDALPGPTLLEFGTNCCGFCQAAQPAIATAFESHPNVHHIKVEDGPGRRLGRSFRVKLWPTLIFLRDGVEVRRIVRPSKADDIKAALEAIVS